MHEIVSVRVIVFVDVDDCGVCVCACVCLSVCVYECLWNCGLLVCVFVCICMCAPCKCTSTDVWLPPAKVASVLMKAKTCVDRALYTNSEAWW